MHKVGTKVIDFSRQDGRWEAILYVCWYEYRDLYAMAWGTSLPPFKFVRPDGLMKPVLRTLDDWARQGCDECLVLAAAYILSHNYRLLKLSTASEIQKDIARIRRSQSALKHLLVESQFAAECRKELVLYASLPQQIDELLKLAANWLKQARRLETDAGKQAVFHLKAIKVIGDHFFELFGNNRPWSQFHSLINSLACEWKISEPREISQESMIRQYRRLKQEEERDRSILHAST